MLKKFMIFCLAFSVLAVACDDDDDGPTLPETSSLSLSFSGLEPLQNGYLYEGWAIIDGSPVSTGVFNINSSGNLVNAGGSLISNGTFESEADLSAASAIVITVEPANDSDPAPSSTHVLGGDLSSSGSASLSAGHSAALGVSFSSSAGVYILATPTNGAETDENSGIWFLSLASGEPAVGLTLPDLPDGWIYEGWTVIDGVPVTSGKFSAVDAVDLSDPYSSTEPGPPFPGEDFLVNAPSGLTFPTDIAGGTAVISVEPVPDDADAPFSLKPLVGDIPAGAADHVTYPLENMFSSLPTGTAAVD